MFRILEGKEIIEKIDSKYSRMDQVKFFKGCLLQILLGPFLNTLSQLIQNENRIVIIICNSLDLW